MTSRDYDSLSLSGCRSINDISLPQSSVEVQEAKKTRESRPPECHSIFHKPRIMRRDVDSPPRVGERSTIFANHGIAIYAFQHAVSREQRSGSRPSDPLQSVFHKRHKQSPQPRTSATRSDIGFVALALDLKMRIKSTRFVLTAGHCNSRCLLDPRKMVSYNRDPKVRLVRRSKFYAMQNLFRVTSRDTSYARHLFTTDE